MNSHVCNFIYNIQEEILNVELLKIKKKKKASL